MNYLFNYDSLPNKNLAITFENYIVHGLEPGGFMTAMLTNKLYRAVNSADRNNQKIIPEIVRWIQIHLPITCYGTHENMKSWMKDEDGIRTKYVEYLKENKFWKTIQE